MRGAALGLVISACLLAAPGARAKSPKDAEGLRYQRTWAAALLQARIRNMPAFVSRHKDG